MSAPQRSPELGEHGDAVQRLLHPRSIAILGASDNPVKLSGRSVDYLKRFGFTGRIVPINSMRGEVQGLPACSSLDEVDGDIDLAFIMLPADQAAEGVRACAKRGIPAAIVGASGFAELGGTGARLQRELAEAIEETGIRVLGPNTLGMISVRDRAVATFTSALDESIELHEGPVAFVSQSGAFGSFIFNESQQSGIGISHYLNSGNELDLSAAEILGGLVETEQTGVLLAYLEGVNHGRGLLDTARRAHELDKPIVAVKVGRSEAGAQAALSHTASLSGQDAVFDGAARQHGIVRVDGTESMLDAAQIFATGRRTRGRRLSTLSVSGGAGALTADSAAAHGIEVREWDEQWQAEMAAVIPAYGSPRNPIDLTAALIAEPNLLRRGLEVTIAHPGTDMIGVLLGCADGCADELIDAIEDAYHRTDRPLVVVWTGGSGRARQRLRDLGIPCYPDSDRAMAALGRLADFSLRPPLPQPQRPNNVDRETARDVIVRAREQGRTQLDEYESTRLIRAYGIPCADSRPVSSPEAAVTAADELGGGVAIKLLSERIGHKSDIGGVRLGLTGAEDVHHAAAGLLHTANTAGVDDARLLVQRMSGGDVELIAGVKQDPAFGPVVVVGIGGVLVEVLADSQVAVAPIDTGTARRMLTSLRGAPLFGELRGRPACDLDAAADVLVRLSWLATDHSADLAELDVNPILLDARGQSLTAVDCLAVLSPEPTERNHVEQY